jgi:hypothetical protein
MARRKQSNLTDDLLKQYGFQAKNDVKYSLDDIGSNFVYQLTTDIHTSIGSVFRELTKNSYDSYLELPETARDEAIDRGIVISRSRDAGGAGKLTIADSGNGRSPEELKRFLQIGLAPGKSSDPTLRRTGFRGIGSWAMIACGSQIIISSQQFQNTTRGILIINVAEMYKTMARNATMEAILNNPECVRFGEAEHPLEEHGTKIEIRCDGPRRWVGSCELNRLYSHTDPEDTDLRSKLLTHCQIAWAKQSPYYRQIAAIYKKARYLPVPVFLDGDPVEKQIPPELSLFDGPANIKLDGKSGKTVAVGWAAENPDQTGVGGVADVEEELVGVQLCVVNSPIGEKNIHSENVRATILKWYVGEVHVVDDDIKPNADGTGLRGDVNDEFITSLQNFYTTLEERAEQKSQEISALRKVTKATASLLKLAEGKAEEWEVTYDVRTAQQAIEKREGEKWSNTTLEKEWKAAVKSIESNNTYRSLLKKKATSGAAKNTDGGTKKTGGTSKRSGTTSTVTIDSKDIQKLVAELILKFEEFNLTKDQIEELLDLIRAAMKSSEAMG